MSRKKQPRRPTDKQLLDTLHGLLPDAPDFRDDQKPVIDQILFAQKVRISMIAVDEAHCLSLWGYDFRPRYPRGARKEKQGTAFPTRYLYIKGLPTSAENLAMTHYLLCRVHMMSAPYKRRTFYAVTNHNLRFDTMLQTLGIDLPDGAWYRDRKVETLWKAKMIPILTRLQAAGVIKRK